MHQLADRREDSGDGEIVLGEFFIQARLELREAPGQLPVGAQELAQVHEGAHDVDAHLDGARRAQDVCRLDSAMLGEGVRKVFDVLTAARTESKVPDMTYDL